MTTITAIFEFLNQLLGIGRVIAKMAQDAETRNWLNSLSEATDKLASAKTIQEKLDAARKLSDITRGLK